MSSPTSFQEELDLQPTGRFVYRCDARSIGIDPEMLALMSQDGRFCFLDFEATGLDIASDALIEVGAVIVSPGSDELTIFNTFVRTELELSPFIKRLTGIRQEDVVDAPEPGDVAAALDDFIGDAPVVAHNARFEQSWLVRLVGARFAEHPFLDTVELLALVYPDTPNMKLDTFCRAKLARKERHRALDDALDTLRICVNLLSEAQSGSPAAANARHAMRLFRPSSPWLPRLSGIPAHEQSRVQLREGSRPAPTDTEPVPWTFDAIAARLSDAELGARVIPGYEPRQAQLELLRHVYDCFAGKNGKTIRICEAGTGIGKTLAYLSVAIPFARQTGEQVIISTSSKLLQSQLMGKDIPAAAALMGHQDLRFTSIKGRANYLCRARLDRFLDRHRRLLPPTDSFPIALLAAFARSTGHGEVDRIPGVLFAMYPELERHVREVASGDASECSRQTCEKTPGECAFRDARARLAGAEIIVVNHDLLLRWPPDYPPLRHLIVDEVHELAERADGAYARTAEAVELVHRIETLLNDGKDTHVVELGKRALHVIGAIGTEAKRVAGSENPDQGYRDELAVPLAGPGPAWAELIELCVELSSILDSVGRRVAEEDDEAGPAGPAEALLDGAGVLAESFPRPTEDIVVRFRGLARQSTAAWRLVATPVSPAADFQFEILDRVETMFGTSATVAVDGDLRGGLGVFELEERSAGRFRMEAPVESPFDYASNLEVVFIDERTDGSQLVRKTADAIAAAALRLSGRTMALFTSRERLSNVVAMLDPVLSAEGITTIAPSTGNADPHDLVRTFMENDHAVLLGARAFWQGVDVPGDACQALVIEKLPFDVPGDPLVARRCEVIDREGRQSFQDYMLPRMLLRLKQMIGRLIRTPTDRGIVIIVEPRCDRSYSAKLLHALPPRASHRRAKLATVGTLIDAFIERRDRR